MPAEFRAGYALLIAVDENKVSNWALPVAEKDIAALHAVLIHPQRCAYPAEHVRVISGQAATRQGILDGLQWLEQQLAADKSGDATAIIYYTGHGWREETASPPDYYFIPYDIQESRRRGTALRAADFAEAIAALKPRRLLVVLDCCHAGGMGVKDVDAGATPFTLAAPPPTLFTEGWGAVKAVGEKGLEQLQSGQGRAVLVSSSGEQKSYVRPDETMSVFTYHLIEALTGHAQPAGGAGEVLVSEVLSYVYRTVPKSAAALGREQQPDGRLDGNFPVALLLGGKGLAKGEPAPDPLTPLPAGDTPGMIIHNESVQAETVNQAKTIYQHSAHAEGGGDATTYNVSGGGVIATGGSVAAGKGGVAVGGDVHGGISIGGRQSTGSSSYAELGNVGGDIKGSIIAGGNIENVQLGASELTDSQRATALTVDPLKLDQLLVPLYDAVGKSDVATDTKAAAYTIVGDLKRELVKGRQQDDSHLAGLVEVLADLAPGISGIMLALFGSPVLAGVAGPVTTHVLTRLRRRLP